MDAIVNINGVVQRAEDAKVSVFDRGFLFGDGVYETGKSRDRCFLFLDEHLERLRRSAGRLTIPIPWSDAQLTDWLSATARAFGKPDLYFRMVVTRGPVERVGLDVEAKDPTFVVIIQNISPTLAAVQSEGVHLATSSVIRNSALAQDPNIKTSNYLNSFLALQDAKRRGASDAIMCDREGHVAEGTTFSVFGVTAGGGLITASLEVGILDSITRRLVLELAKGLLNVREDFFKLNEFQACREVFIASSIREIIPVRQWDNLTYKVPGRYTREIATRLKAQITDYVRTHPKF